MEQNGGKSRRRGATVTGEFQHSLDNKSRLFIPAKLREELGDVFYMTLSMERCLCVYSAENWQVFSDKVGAMPYVQQRRMRPLFAHAARCELDSQGRTIIPQKAAITTPSFGTARPGSACTRRNLRRKISPRPWRSLASDERIQTRFRPVGRVY